MQHLQALNLMNDSTIMSGAEVVAHLKDEQEWAEKVKEMDRLCKIHLNASYEDCAVQGHYIFVKLGPDASNFPLKNEHGLMMPLEEQVNPSHFGLVVAYGRYAFVDGPATKWVRGPLCKLGQYIGFYTPECIRTTFNGYPVAHIRDSNILTTTTKPHLFGNYTVGRSKLPRNAKKIIFKRNDIADLGLTCSDPTILFREDFEEDLK